MELISKTKDNTSNLIISLFYPENGKFIEKYILVNFGLFLFYVTILFVTLIVLGLFGNLFSGIPILNSVFGVFSFLFLIVIILSGFLIFCIVTAHYSLLKYKNISFISPYVGRYFFGKEINESEIRGFVKRYEENKRKILEESQRNKVKEKFENQDAEWKMLMEDNFQIYSLLEKYISKNQKNPIDYRFRSGTEFDKLKELVERKTNKRYSELELKTLLESVQVIYVKKGYRALALSGTTIEEIIEKFVQITGSKGTTDYAISNLTEALSWRFQKEYNSFEITEKVQAKIRDFELSEFENKLDFQGGSIEEVDQLDGHGFEDYLWKLFKNQGYNVTKMPTSRDYGVDLIIEKFGRKIAVQAKHYFGTVPNKAIQEVHTGKEFYRCDEAWIVTQSRMSGPSIRMAETLGVKIIAREELQKMI